MGRGSKKRASEIRLHPQKKSWKSLKNIFKNSALIILKLCNNIYIKNKKITEKTHFHHEPLAAKKNYNKTHTIVFLKTLFLPYFCRPPKKKLVRVPQQRVLLSPVDVSETERQINGPGARLMNPDQRERERMVRIELSCLVREVPP